MKNIAVNEAYKELIPLPNQTSTDTLPYVIYKESDGATFASGNLTFVAGIHWSLSFTPTVVDELYFVEVDNPDGDVIFTSEYKCLTTVEEVAEDPTVTTSKTELVNKALVSIGAETISSLTDGTTNADIMNTVYKIALKKILSECLWGFATKRALLTTSTTSLAWSHNDESYTYDKPTDIIRIFGTNDDYAIWRDEGDVITSDTAGLGIKYIYYLDNPAKYSPSFIEAFVDLLAYQAAVMILNDPSLAQKLLQKYEKISLQKAESENAQTGTQQYVRDDAWELSKYSNGSSEA
jgi:hypothetical protein